MRKITVNIDGRPISLPPIHQIINLTYASADETFAACLRYRMTPGGGISLTWLRMIAYELLSGQLTRDALIRAAKARLPKNAVASVVKAIDLLVAYVKRQQWRGGRLSPLAWNIGRGLMVPLDVAGVFQSATVRQVVLLQPRLDFHPAPWQMEIWMTLINQAYCSDPLAPASPLILDVARNKETDQRDLAVLGSKQLRILSESELNKRLDIFIDAYLKAFELVPVRPQRPSKDIKAVSDQLELPHTK